ncbi:MAG: hypothetical protein ACOX56_05215 [Acholeplasmataceae bacterium]
MEWIKDLEQIEIIYLVVGFLLVVLVLIILVVVLRISREIASRSLKMSEEILNTDTGIVTNIKIVNRSYIDNEITEIGMIYQKKKVVILEEKTRVSARNRFEYVITHAQVRELLGVDEFKIKRIKFYYENSVGNIKKSSARLTRREIKKALKQEKKDYIQALKEKRYKDGTFTTGDRISIFFQNICAPFKKARHNSVIKRNKKIADRKAQKEVEAERQKLIEEQKLILEQIQRETMKKESREELKVEELKNEELKAELEKAKKEAKEKEEELAKEEKATSEKEAKENKKDKKENKQEEKSVEADVVIEEEKVVEAEVVIEEEKVDDEKNDNESEEEKTEEVEKEASKKKKDKK